MSRTLEILAELTPDELRKEWRRLYRSQPPGLAGIYSFAPSPTASRNFAMAGSARRPAANLPRSCRRGAPIADTATASTQKIRSGARLVREWNGRTHTVTVEEEGFTYAGRNYRSLTAIAREITGARWSGPRFFGLAGKRGASDA